MWIVQQLSRNAGGWVRHDTHAGPNEARAAARNYAKADGGVYRPKWKPGVA